MENTLVAVSALNPITRAGLDSCLRTWGMRSVEPGSADVIVGAFDGLDAAAIGELASTTGASAAPVVLLVDDAGVAELPFPVQGRVAALLSQDAIADQRFPRVVRSAAAERTTRPPDVPVTATTSGESPRRVEVSEDIGRALTDREICVLDMLSEGLATEEIGRRLQYSERTVKNILYGVMSRLGLRNRPHAVAYALRGGFIC